MKNLLIVSLLILLFNSNIYGQKVKPVPIIVRKAFEQKFPKIKKIIWDNSKVKMWEAEFRMNGSEYSVLFNVNGTWIKTEHEIGKNEIPTAIKSTLLKEFGGYKVIEAQISETANSKVYKIELNKEGQKVMANFDIHGKVLKKESVSGIYKVDETDGIE